jgi:hypothetical protein
MRRSDEKRREEKRREDKTREEKRKEGGEVIHSEDNWRSLREKGEERRGEERRGIKEVITVEWTDGAEERKGILLQEVGSGVRRITTGVMTWKWWECAAYKSRGE